MTQSPSSSKKQTPRRHYQPVSQSLRDEISSVIQDDAPRRDLLIEYLHRIHDRYNAITLPQLKALSEIMGLSQVEVFEVASFYAHFDILHENESAPLWRIRVCRSPACAMAGAEQLISELQAIKGVKVESAPCMGQCDHPPAVMLNRHVVVNACGSQIRQRIADQRNEPVTDSEAVVNPITYADYLNAGGYQLWQRCLADELNRDDVIQAIEDSGLRGLGGAGFPAGRKWRILSQQAGEKVLVVNIDEGEPGTFKDRYYLERDPHRVLEGALIGAWAVNAQQIYLYLRDEYPALHDLLRQAIDELQSGTGASLPEIHLRRGAGAYICGEESALVESLEGKRGMPRLRPPYIAERGVFGLPTLEHNMETLYWVPEVIQKGPESFGFEGRRGRIGMRSFSVSGRVKKPGVYRAPAGISARELINEYAGGMQSGHELYGYFPGGASGGMLPERLADLPLDFGTLEEYGCFIGSAAVIVFSKADSAKKLALDAMRFFADESCGQCTPCRVGTVKAVELMQRKNWDQTLLHELAQTMMDGSICGLGQAAPNPLLCAMNYFAKEFEA